MGGITFVPAGKRQATARVPVRNDTGTAAESSAGSAAVGGGPQLEKVNQLRLTKSAGWPLLKVT
jgi:hypothetical protein